MSFDKKEYQKRYMKQKRLERRGLTPESNIGAEMLESNGDSLTQTDRKFEEVRPNYYIYGATVREMICFQCYKKFKTRMSLLKFCSPECQKAKLKSFETVGTLSESEVKG